MFSERELWTMAHGLVLGGMALLVFPASLYCAWSLRSTNADDASVEQRGIHLGRLTTGIAVVLWLTAIVGTFSSFPAYRSPPPLGASDLQSYPKALILSRPETAWLHSFAMEIKEHVPWMIVILMSAVSFVAARHRASLQVPWMLDLIIALIGVSFALTAIVGVLGVLVNKVAPLR